MRLLPLGLLLAVVLSAGCMGEEPDDPAAADAEGGLPFDSNADGIPDTGVDADGDGVPEPLPPVPAPLVFTGSLKGMGDVSANSPVSCPLQEQQCVTHVATVPAGSWNVTFTLVGTDGTVTSVGLPYSTDYDLFVEGVGESTNPGGEEDVVSKRLSGGDYSAQVLAWHDVDGEYTLTVSFAY